MKLGMLLLPNDIRRLGRIARQLTEIADALDGSQSKRRTRRRKARATATASAVKETATAKERKRSLKTVPDEE